MTFLSALILGLLASAHCAAMCSGLQIVMQESVVLRTPTQANQHLLALNLGRISTYVLAGVVVASVGSSLVEIIDVPKFARLTRIFSAVILIIVGLQLLLSNKRPFAWIERFGLALWGVIRKGLALRDVHQLRHSYYQGLIWGFLPCGLVYGVLLTTLFLNNGYQAALTMLGFGLGTLPSMLLAGSLYQHFRKVIQNRALKWVGGFIFIQGGLLMLFAPLIVNKDFMNNYPQLMLNMFCL